MTFEQLKADDERYVLNTYSRFPVAIKSGGGARCYDEGGREYIDFTSGIGVNSLGFCDEGWVSAVCSQAASLQHTSNLFYTEPCVALAKTLCERTGMKKVFFANSGAEANEGAIKAARKHSFVKHGEGRSTLVTLVNSFHGRTVTTLAATGQDVFHNWFFPFTEGFAFAEANDPASLEGRLERGDACAVMLELVQGEGGVIALDKSYVAAVARLCEEKDLLLIVDEVQTGVGRTGTLFAFEQYGIKPDIVTSAKGLGGGLPLGAVLFGEKAEGALARGDHASTFGGNPVACAGANYILSRMDGGFLKEVAQKGDYIREKLLAMPHVSGVSGLGMMIGASLEGVKAADAVARAITKGALVLTAKSKLRLLPPLNITYNEIDEGLCALSAALGSL